MRAEFEGLEAAICAGFARSDHFAAVCRVRGSSTISNRPEAAVEVASGGKNKLVGGRSDIAGRCTGDLVKGAEGKGCGWLVSDGELGPSITGGGE